MNKASQKIIKSLIECLRNKDKSHHAPNFKGNETDTKQKYSEVRELIFKKINTFKQQGEN